VRRKDLERAAVATLIGLTSALQSGNGRVAAAESEATPPPRVDFVFPLAAGWLAETSLHLHGELGSLPLHGWCDDPGVTLTRGASNDVFTLSVSTNAIPGPKWLRFANAVGVTAWLPFLLSDAAEILARPDTNAPVAVAVPTLPAGIHSRLLPHGWTNQFFVQTRTNELLEVKLQGLALDSPVHARLQVRDERGVVLASASTTNLADPALALPMVHETRWQVEVAALTNFPAAAFAMLGVPFRLSLTATDLPPQQPADGSVILTPHPELQRPHLTPRITFPGLVNGIVSSPLEEDFYGFDAVAGQAYWVRLKTASISSPLRGSLRILDDRRKVVSEALAGPDPELAWTAPADGRYAIVAGAQAGSGGLDCVYQLEFGRPRADLRATLPTHTIPIEPGAAATLEVAVIKPPSFDQLLIVSVQGLPPGVTAAPAHCLPEMGRATLTLRAAADAPATNVPCQVSLLPVVPPVVVEFARAPILGRHAPEGRLLRNEAEHFWLLVRPGPPAR
jgi:hypothetical protein